MKAPRWLVQAVEVFGVLAWFGSLFALWWLS